jgi:hypothetical protein
METLHMEIRRLSVVVLIDGMDIGGGGGGCGVRWTIVSGNKLRDNLAAAESRCRLNRIMLPAETARVDRIQTSKQ